MGFHCINLTKTYSTQNREVIALKGIDFSVSEQEFVCIVGPSGCGKTTLLKIIAGLVRPSSGKVRFINESNSTRPKNSMVFQDQSLFPWMNILENVAFGLEMRGVSKQERHNQARDFMQRVGLGEFMFNYPRELSGGMRQRVAILRAFLNDPQVLLMDEPFGALDSQTRLVMQDELLRIWKEHKKTVIYITHDIEEAILLGDRVLVMSGRPGMIQADLAIPFDRPRTLSVRDHPEMISIRQEIWSMIEREVRQDLRILA
jgi:NitT/TauT family transport system ATP-binding protein